jgi:hypothetical protein
MAKRNEQIRPQRVTEPVMASYDGIFRTSFRYPPFSLDKLTQQKGYDTADDMLTMAACRAPFNLKRYAVLADGWEIVPAVMDPFDTRHAEALRYADFVRWCFQNIRSQAGLIQDFRAVLFEILRACWQGYRVSEIGYRYIEEGPYVGRLGYDGFYAKHSKQIGFDLDPRTSQVLHITSYTPGAGSLPGEERRGAVPGGYDFKVPVEKCILYTYNVDSGLPHGDGDWRANYKHWFVLDNIQRFWAIALERWGAPVLIAEAPSEDSAAFTAAQATLDAIRQGAAAVVPENIRYQIATVSQNVFEGFRIAADWHTQQIALNIQANTLSTGAGQNSLALGEVHQETGETVYQFLRRDLESVMYHQVIRRLMEVNFADFDMTLCPRLWLGGQDAGDRLKIAQMFDLLIRDGVVSRRAKFIREVLSLPPLDKEEEQMLNAEQQVEQEAQQQIADARNSGQVAAMSDAEYARAKSVLTEALLATHFASSSDPTPFQ